MTFALALLIGALVGLLAGALGVGGGILAVPVLVYLLGQDPHAATAESLVIVLVSSVAALPSRFRRHQVRLAVGVVFGFCSALGAVAGTWLNRVISGDAVMLAFAVLLAGVAVLMGRNGLRERRLELVGSLGASAAATDDTTGECALTWRRLPVYLVLGTFTGIMVGFFGIGGGFAMVPVLVLLMRFPTRVAQGTSFVVISVVSVISILTRVLGPLVAALPPFAAFASGVGVAQTLPVAPLHIDWLVAILFALGSGVGSAVGSPLSNRVRASTLTFMFVLLLVAVSIYTAATTLLA